MTSIFDEPKRIYGEDLVNIVLGLSTTNITGGKLFVFQGNDTNAIGQYIWTLFQKNILDGFVTTADHILFERFAKDNNWASLFERSTVNVIFLSDYEDLNRHKEKLISLVEGNAISYKEEGSKKYKYVIPKATQIFVTKDFPEKNEVDKDLRDKMYFIHAGISSYMVKELTSETDKDRIQADIHKNADEGLQKYLESIYMEEEK